MDAFTAGAERFRKHGVCTSSMEEEWARFGFTSGVPVLQKQASFMHVQEGEEPLQNNSGIYTHWRNWGPRWERKEWERGFCAASDQVHQSLQNKEQ